MVSSNPHTSKIEYGCQLKSQELNRWHLERRICKPTVHYPHLCLYRQHENERWGSKGILWNFGGKYWGRAHVKNQIYLLCYPDLPNAFPPGREKQKVVLLSQWVQDMLQPNISSQYKSYCSKHQADCGIELGFNEQANQWYLLNISSVPALWKSWFHVTLGKPFSISYIKLPRLRN